MAGLHRTDITKYLWSVLNSFPKRPSASRIGLNVDSDYKPNVLTHTDLVERKADQGTIDL